MSINQPAETDVVLIGAGIMSATLGLMLKELNPDWSVKIVERLSEAAVESSDAWNNAGTGHSAFCELNYTPETKTGAIDVTKAVNICEQFEISRQFWAYLVEKNIIQNPKDFIHSVPHMSFVWGDENVTYLNKRYASLKNLPLFSDMEFAEDACQIKKWAPLIMQGRSSDDKVAATFMKYGTDVNFGTLTRKMIAYQAGQSGTEVTFNTEVYDVKQQSDGRWEVMIKDLKTGEKKTILTKFVFVGAGGASILLLEKSGIPEGKHYGGFPVSGQWLICQNEKLIEQHQTKVYGKASVGAPPMSVPHLDTRYIDGKKSLLFGPYAGFSTKFLKNGSYCDLFKSINFSNLSTMLGAGVKNIDLTAYLIGEVLQSQNKRVEALKNYFPDAQAKDWRLETAGQRVQTMKRDAKGKAVLAFGTEVVSSADGSFSALLGASPGASTTVSIMLNLLERCFNQQFNNDWQEKLKNMIPSFGIKLNDNEELLQEVRKKTSETLELEY
ncbi:malate:quinone oxidoreductase [Avrilella dinanensis]|uniref:Probable malate:quinone oxidoreductase n=1 Tax=Avrilella dinanensis TaxID=2008672 RepID=A0A2M9R6S2_9FLAO|nr:malate:quinone oxidoreductase [Avrilella dinanensis]PJR04550.1 malate:quinone oxidoreductase [Avrilella dinanensis]